MKSIPLSKYFELKKPKYVYIKIIPHKSIRNYNSTNITKAIAHTHKAINKRIYKEQKKLFFETNFKISYIIDIHQKDASFYFLVPTAYKSIICEKINEIWRKATLEILDTPIEKFNDNTVRYELSYKKEDALSLYVDKKSNEPLNSILSIMDTLKSTDRITIIYNFLPTEQSRWIQTYEETIDKIKKRKPVDKNILTPFFIFKSILGIVLMFLDSAIDVISDFLGSTRNPENERLYTTFMNILEGRQELSNLTKRKKEQSVIETEIAVISSSNDISNAETNATSICQSFHVLDGDNELLYKKTKSKFRIEDFRYNLTSSLLSTDEASNFVQIPARTLLEEHSINHITLEETLVPEELQNGIFCLGTNTYKGTRKKAYLSTDKDMRNLTFCIIGPTRAGKTNFLKHLCKNAIDNNQTVIIPDFCGNCELSKDIASVIPKEKTLTIDCSNIEELQGLGYSDIKPKDNSAFHIYNATKIRTQQLKTLINSINTDNNLEPRMEKYLNAASLVAFINNGSVKDVFKILQDHQFRMSAINNIPKNQLENLEDYILSLKELDEYSKGKDDEPPEVIGTKISYVQGILNRVEKLKQNTYIEMMLKKDCSKNIDLLSELEKGQLICLRMPETMFSTEEEKDIYATYWLTKIWGVLQVRYDNIPNELDRTKVNLVFDELYQVPKCQEFLKTKINQIAKKTAMPIISCHSLEQIKYIRPELKSANTSYCLISGCNKDNYTELKEELAPYQLEDLLGLKRFYALNLIKCQDGYARFITELPPKFK